MDEIEIKKNNKLIAEFMGISPINDLEYPYHCSWDCLVPVYNKCQKLFHIMEATFETASQHLQLSNGLDFFGTLNIDNLYKVIINFIKWFNNLTI